MKFHPSEQIEKKEKKTSFTKEERENYLKKTVFEIGQGHIFETFLNGKLDQLRWQSLMLWLDEIDRFFFPIGGVKGLEKKIIEMLHHEVEIPFEAYPYSPKKPDFDENNFKKGISYQKNIIEVVVLGGTAERLNFKDEVTQEPLPAFLYPFMEKTLLEWIILDIQSKERLMEELFGESKLTPIVLMTSASKNNKELLLSFLEEKRFFDRPKSSFCLLEQPLVPYVDRQGKWCLDELQNIQKAPCGHGAVWKLLHDSKELQNVLKEKTHVLVRQINNPILSFFDTLPLFVQTTLDSPVDLSLLVTDTLPGAKEGKIILKKNGRFTNLEYIHNEVSDLFGFANVNAIIMKLNVLNSSVLQNPFPGFLLNFKGKEKARPEMSMQNIVDSIENVLVVHFPRQCAISAIKREGKGLETADAAVSIIKNVYKEHSSGSKEGEVYTRFGCRVLKKL